MVSLLVSALVLSCIGSFVSASIPSAGLPIHNITRFESLKIENLAVRSNGLILATVNFPSPKLLQIDPLGIVPPTTVLEIPGTSGLTGITEGQDDIFYIAAGNFSIKTFTGDNYGIYKVNMTNFETLPNGTHTREAEVHEVAELPHAILANGLATVNDGVVLAADSLVGVVWRIDVTTGAVTIAANDTALKGPKGAAGVNGINIFNHSLYWTNTGLQGLYRIPISPDGVSHGSAELVADKVFGDDFLITKRGAYVASPADVLLHVFDGKQQIIAGTFNSTLSGLVGPTAVRFGRLATDRSSLYISTNGGVKDTVSGTPGVSRVDLDIPFTESDC